MNLLAEDGDGRGSQHYIASRSISGHVRRMGQGQIQGCSTSPVGLMASCSSFGVVLTMFAVPS